MYVGNHHHGPGCSGDEILEKRESSGAGLGRPHVSIWRHSGRGDQVVEPGCAAGIIFWVFSQRNSSLEFWLWVSMVMSYIQFMWDSSYPDKT